ncbi:MAG: LURP-one-related family protein [Oscillospiraceae bacterium]|jgi:uncharacterized protein YxjI|nr:LURP-one-related family protein [Oscillospiraceae bacterium]
MKLYIKQKVFSWRDRFAVKDEAELDRWFAQGEIFTLGRKLHVYDANGAEVAFIRQKVLSFLWRYYIEIGGNVYEFVKEFTFLRPKYTIRNLDWVIDGNFTEHEYAVTSSRGDIMRISKAWPTWGDFYKLEITEPQNELLCLCVALAIDCINADAASRASN